MASKFLPEISMAKRQVQLPKLLSSTYRISLVEEKIKLDKNIEQ
jgi:hypothetical protein